MISLKQLVVSNCGISILLPCTFLALETEEKHLVKLEKRQILPHYCCRKGCIDVNQAHPYLNGRSLEIKRTVPLYKIGNLKKMYTFFLKQIFGYLFTKPSTFAKNNTVA